MHTKIPPLAAVGVAALGICWASSLVDVASASQDPAAPMPSSSPADPSPSPTPAAEPDGPPMVLLKTDGDVLFGEVLEDPSGYYVKHRIGPRHVARRNTLGVFQTLEEAYEYRKARVPANDADEQLKLAQWCLGLDLKEQARGHLEAVLAANPESGQARSMLFHLETEGSAALDKSVARTSADVPVDDPGRPRELSPGMLERLRSLEARRDPAGPPVIFDLPPTLAIRRYQEFAGDPHALIQARCANCHDADRYAGDFRVVRARVRRDLANDPLVRTNLDATLRLVDPVEPSRSELLRVAGLTHPSDGRPVLNGPNDPLYRLLKQWVMSLQDPAKADADARAAGYTPSLAKPAPAVPSGEGFAVDRFGGASASPASVDNPTPQSVGSPPGAGVVDGFRAVETGVAPGVPADTEFPTPGLPTAMPDPAAAPNAQPGSVITREDGSQAMVMPDGQLVDFVSKSDQMKSKPPTADPAKAPATNPTPTPAPSPTPATSAPPTTRPLPPVPAPTPSPAPATPAPPADPKPPKAVPKADRSALEKFLRKRAAPGG